MKTLKCLIETATECSNFRGHKLGGWTTSDIISTRHAADCTICGKGVTINTHPAPNEAEIMGDAMVFPCDDWEDLPF
jgi:hypothetical protein